MVLVAQLLLSRFPQDAGESLRQLEFVAFVVVVQTVGVDALQERHELSSGCTSFQATAKSHNISMYKAAAIAKRIDSRFRQLAASGYKSTVQHLLI